MSHVLVVNTSPLVGASVTRRLSAYVALKLAFEDPNIDITYREIGTLPPPHIDHDLLRAMRTPPDQREFAQHTVLAESDRLVAEVATAETLVIGAPLSNFGIPSALGAWFDYVMRPGVTYKSGPSGVDSLLASKKAFVITATADDYNPCAINDCFANIRPFFESSLRLLGADEIHFIQNHDHYRDDEVAEADLDEALYRIDYLTEAPTLRRLPAPDLEGAA